MRPWWRTDSAGKLVMSVYYGTKPIEFEKGKAGIAVASRDKLPALIDALIGAAQGRRARRADGAHGQAGRRAQGPPRGLIDGSARAARSVARALLRQAQSS